MNTMQRFATVLVAVLVAAAAPPAGALDLGDPAPPLTISEWVRGDAVNINDGLGKKVYLVEFWATWCPPCKASIPLLTETQQKYKDELVIIGVTAPDSRRNSAKAVRKFVKERGEKMSYTVALDKNDATTNAYMLAANVVGIPHAFLVDRDGNIAWQGSPLDPAMGMVIHRVIEGKYDVKAAKVESQVNARLERVFQALQFGEKPPAIWDSLADILKLDPGNEYVLASLAELYYLELRDPQAFRSWAESYINAHSEDATVLSHVAAALCGISDISLRVPDLAIEAAGKAHSLQPEPDAEVAAIYARALFQIGDVDRAIRFQEQALASASDSQKEPSQRVLDHYKLCQQLRSAAN